MKKTEKKPAEKKQLTGAYKHNWIALKEEFFKGDYLTVSSFLRQKGINEKYTAFTSGWAKEKKALDKKALDKFTQQKVDDEFRDLNQVRVRQARLARFLQRKGLARLSEAKPEELSIDDARKFILTGLKEERSALGLDSGTINQNLNINLGPQTNLDKLVQDASYEEVLELIATIKRERATRTGSNSITSGNQEITDGEIV